MAEAKKRKTTPQKRGRKNYWDIMQMSEKLDLVEAWARDGYTDEEIYKSLGVSKDTFYKWKKEKVEFADALKSGKEVVDYQVEKALLKRAVGYSYIEETKERMYVKDANDKFVYYEDENGIRRRKTELVVTKTVVKEVHPDTAAAFIWLKNRRPDKWRDRHEVVQTGVGAPVFIDDLTDDMEDGED